MKKVTVMVISFIIGSPLLCNLSAEVITTKTLIKEMIDVCCLSEFPSPAYKTIQFSSYDRNSNLPQSPGWFSNNDGFGFTKIPNFQKQLTKHDKDFIAEYLVCDVKGPGAIVRVWTAYIAGEIKLFLDDMDKPFFEGSAIEFFRYPHNRYTRRADIEKKISNKVFQHFDASYFPVPFSKRCKIIWKGDIKQTHFYQIQIRKYEAGTKVITFKGEDIKQCKNEILEIAETFSAPNEKWQYESKLEPMPIKVTVEPNQKLEAFSIKGGSKAIERLTLKVCADDIDLALRQTVLNIIFDDYPWGQVQAPIGDFFGAAPGVNPYDSVPFTVEPDGTMTCRFIMP
ncbi:MAG: DUF2961 domain-containing protein, partial [Planctomycetota bacterium]